MDRFNLDNNAKDTDTMYKLKCLLFFLLPLIGFAQKPELVVPIGHSAGINSVAFSPDEQRILTGSSDGTVKLWDLKGHELQSFRMSVGGINSVSFSPDGQRILAGGAGENAKLWNLEGQELQPFPTKVLSLVYSSDGQKVLVGNPSSEVLLFDSAGQKLQSYEGYQFGNSLVAFTSDGQQLLTGSYDWTATLWDLEGNKLKSFFEEAEGLNYMTFSSNGQRILTGSIDGTIKVYDLSGQELHSFKGHTTNISSAAFSPDGQQIATANFDGIMKLWDLQGQELQTFTGHIGGVTSMIFTSDGQQILTGGDDGTARLWNISGHQIQAFMGHAFEVKSSVFSHAGQQLLTGNSDGIVRLWDLEGKEIYPWVGHSGEITSVKYSHDGQQILTASEDGTAKLWDLKGKELVSLEGHSDRIMSAVFSPDGQQILTASLDKTVKLWNLEGQNLQTFQKHASGVLVATFSPDGQQFITGSEDGTVKSWDLRGKKLQSFKGHSKDVYSIAFTPDGQQILTGSYDDKVKLWDLNGKELKTIEDPDHRIMSVSLSPNGDQILTGSYDGTVKLWDLEGKELQSFEGLNNWIWSLAFSPDGQKILATSNDRRLKIWASDGGEEIATLIGVDLDNWIVTTPSGLFDASPDAMNLMHYSVFYGGEYEVVELEQLKARYYEPGLLQKLLGFSDERIRPVESFNEVKLYPKIQASIKENVLDVKLTQRSGGLGKVSIFINGKEVVEEANPLPRGSDVKRKSSFTYDLGQHKNYLYRHPDSTNIVSLRAYNEDGWLKSQAIELKYKPVLPSNKNDDSGETEFEGEYDPKFYVLSIGTSQYTGDKLDLKYADQDATLMAKALYAVGKALVPHPDSLEVYCFSTANVDSTGLEDTDIQWAFAEKKNIEARLDWIKQKAKAEDVIIVYLSGHGVAQRSKDQTEFYYLTHAVSSEEDLSDPATLKAYTISSEELTQQINNIPALKQVLIIDACNSGQVVENIMGGAQKAKNMNSSQIRALDRMKDRTGMFILSGSASNKVSYEASEYGQGLLTYALLQGMLSDDGTLKDIEGKLIIDVMRLFQYARNQVPELAKSINGIQKPILGFPSRSGSIAIGILSDSAIVDIRKNLSDRKPVIIRSNFFNKNTFLDDLNLASLLETALKEETEKGSEANLIYVDVHNYPGAYSVSGLYEKTEEEIKVQVKLFKDKKSPIDLEIRSTGDPKRLVRYIVREIKRAIK